jgi:tripartite-type tricarboxylate transporter receptor subunit TctC
LVEVRQSSEECAGTDRAARRPPPFAEIVAVIRTADFTHFMAQGGRFIVTSTPDEVGQRIQSDFASLSRLVKAVNLKVDE